MDSSETEREEEWTETKTFTLIEAYKQHPILWDPKNENYFRKSLKNDAWCEIADMMSLTEERCRGKMLSLLSSYRREKAKMQRTSGSGKESSDVYKTRWYAFEAMKFLEDRDKPRKRKKTIPVELPTPEERKQDTVAPTTSKQVKNDADIILSEVLSVLKTTTDKLRETSGMSSEIKSFVTFIGNKMKSYSVQTRNSVQHAFFEIIMRADNGFYDYSQTENTPQSDYSKYDSLRPDSSHYATFQGHKNQMPLLIPKPEIELPASVDSRNSENASSTDDFSDLI